MSLEILIDHREKDLKKEHIASYPEVSFQNLDLGDIIFKYNQQIVLLIERKTFSDLIASVNDGRYREQKQRLKSSQIPQNRIMYLLEGNLLTVPGELKTIYGMIINTILRDNYFVYRTMNLEETVYLIQRLKEKLQKYPEKIIPNFLISKNQETENQDLENQQENQQIEYLKTIKKRKKDNLTVENCSILQLSQIPGISIKTAKKILDHFGNLQGLCCQLRDQMDLKKRKELISLLEIEITNGKKRKIGPKNAETIIKYLGFSEIN